MTRPGSPKHVHFAPEPPSSPSIPSNITLRPAKASDCEALATCFYTSFYPSHPFWFHEWKPEILYSWFIEAFRMSIVDDHTTITFAAVDTSLRPDNSPENRALPAWEQKGANTSDGRVVAFARWRVPQEDGNLEEKWPELPEGLDMEVMGAFFGGMEVNHADLMGSRPHWFLQLLGTETEYQKLGIGRCFVQWGCKRADEERVECYVDASSMGAKLYKGCGFVSRKRLDIPDKNETYGHLEYASFVRPWICQAELEWL